MLIQETKGHKRTYERKERKINYDTTFFMRMSTEDLKKLELIAQKQNKKPSTLAREIIQEYIEKEYENDN